MDTCLIAIIKQGDIIRKAVQHMYLVGRQRRTTVSHHVLDASLMHGNHVGIPLHHEHAVFLHDGLLSLVDAIEFALLVVDIRVGRVDILLCHTFCTTV